MLDLKALLTKLVQHYNNIGIGKSGGTATAKSIANSTSWQDLGVSESMPAGIYFVDISVRFASRTSGYRSLAICADGERMSGSVVHYEDKGACYLTSSIMIDRSSSNWTLSFQVRQYVSGGSALNVSSYYWRTMRVK